MYPAGDVGALLQTPVASHEVGLHQHQEKSEFLEKERALPQQVPRSPGATPGAHVHRALDLPAEQGAVAPAAVDSAPPTSLAGLDAAHSRPRLRGRLHAVAAALSVGALVWLVHSAASIEATVAAWVYGVAAILCYLTSSTYHVLARSDRTRALFRRADHSMIYVLIAGSSTPICLLAMHGRGRWIMIGVVWVGAVVGIAVSLAPKHGLSGLSVALYLALGWTGVAAFPALSHSPLRLALVVMAGVLYTVGAVLFGRQRPTLRPAWFGYHEFWHSIGIAAGALLFVVNFSLIASRTP